MLKLERQKNNEKITIIVSDKAIEKSNTEAKYWGYLPYELTKQLRDKGAEIPYSLSKVWNITDKGNITIRNQNTAINVDGQYFAIPMFSVITYLEDKGFKIDISHLGDGYVWKLYGEHSYIWSEHNTYTNDFYDCVCDMINDYVNECKEI